MRRYFGFALVVLAAWCNCGTAAPIQFTGNATAQPITSGLGRAIEGVLKHMVVDYPSVLHIGCGSGELIRELRTAGIDARGVEDARLGPLDTQGGAILTSDLSRLVIPDTWPPHSLAIMLDVVQHFPEQTIGALLRAALERGRQGATVVILALATPGEGNIRRGVQFLQEARLVSWVQAVESSTTLKLAVEPTILLRDALFARLAEPANVTDTDVWLAKNVVVFAQPGARWREIRHVPSSPLWYSGSAVVPHEAALLMAQDALDYQNLLDERRPKPAASVPERKTTVQVKPDGQVPPVPEAPPVGCYCPGTPPKPPRRSMTMYEEYLAMLTYDNSTLYIGTNYSAFLISYGEIAATTDPELRQQLVDDLHFTLLKHLQYFHDTQVMGDELLRFFSAFLFVISRPEMSVLRAPQALQYVHHNPMIAQVTHGTVLGSTDPQVLLLSNNANGLVQMLALYGPYNKMRISADQLWPQNQVFADYWLLRTLTMIFQGALASPTYLHSLDTMLQFFIDHEDAWPQNPIAELPFSARSYPWYASHELYFAITYIDADREPIIKDRINTFYARWMMPDRPLPTPRHSPKGNRVAVICAQWKEGHSVHRNFHQYVKALQKHFHVTLIFIASEQIGGESADRSGFHAVHVIPDDQTDTTAWEKAHWIVKQQFDIIFYPQAGMHQTDVLLINHRLAPIQLSSYGHSTSSFGADIDYFIGGEEVETDTPQYSESLLMVPGMGIIFDRMVIDPKWEAPTAPAEGDVVIINCAWTMVKLTPKLLRTLQYILNAVNGERPVQFRFFSAVSVDDKHASNALLADMRDELGLRYHPKASIRVIPATTYEAYMASVQQAHLALDSFPFGGCNTVFDSLIAGVPIVTWEGRHWRNRIGPAMLRRIGLHELIATNEREYISITTRLILDDDYRASIMPRVNQTYIEQQLCDVKEAASYPTLFKWLVERSKAGKELPKPPVWRFSDLDKY